MLRAALGKYPVPTFEDPAFNTAKPLSESTVAIVTTAGLRKDGDPAWKPNDPSYRLFSSDDHDVSLGHLSPNFDRSGFVADINVAYPIDRLKEMADEGIIKAAAPRHASFMGAQDENMDTIRMDTGPALAAELKNDGVDVVLLTPV
jgi:D-proline reductase (dithiol) PrdB